MEKPPRSVAAVQLLIITNADFWLVYAFISALGWIPGLFSAGPGRWLMAFLSLGTSGALGTLACFLARRKKWAYILTLVLLGLVGILSITDEIGVLDVFTMVISLAAFFFLVVDRAWYLRVE